MSKSCIGYAVSEDGVNWMRREEPVLVPEEHWERYCVMCPHVLWDDEDNIFKMWYSAGHMHESDAIGYAESPDGTTGYGILEIQFLCLIRTITGI